MPQAASGPPPPRIVSDSVSRLRLRSRASHTVPRRHSNSSASCPNTLRSSTTLSICAFGLILFLSAAFVPPAQRPFTPHVAAFPTGFPLIENLAPVVLQHPCRVEWIVSCLFESRASHRFHLFLSAFDGPAPTCSTAPMRPRANTLSVTFTSGCSPLFGFP